MKVVGALIVVAVVALAGYTYLFQGGDQTNELVDDSSDEVAGATAGVTAGGSSANTEEAESVAGNAEESVSPFASVPTDTKPEELASGEPATEDVTNNIETADVSGDTSQPAETTTAELQSTEPEPDTRANELTDPIVVPSSFPVTDAEKYFIPKDQRGPGRLGGPPPLNFPGGPSDPNKASGSAFAPPPAPGQ